MAAPVTAAHLLHHPAARVAKAAKAAKAERVAKAAKVPIDPHQSHAGTTHAQWSLHLTISSVPHVSRSTHSSKSAPDATRQVSSAAPATIAAARSTVAASSTHPLIEPSPQRSPRLRNQATFAPTLMKAGAPPLEPTNSPLRTQSCPTPIPTRPNTRTTHAPLFDLRLGCSPTPQAAPHSGSSRSRCRR